MAVHRPESRRPAMAGLRRKWGIRPAGCDGDGVAGDGGEVEGGGMTTTNFDIYQMTDTESATCFDTAGEAWDVALQVPFI